MVTRLDPVKIGPAGGNSHRSGLTSHAGIVVLPSRTPSYNRSLVEAAEVPGRIDPFEHREGAVVLSEREDPPQREPESPADQRAIRAPVRNDDDGPAGVRVRDGLEGRPRPRLEVRQALAVRKRELADVRHPFGELLGLALPDLGGSEPFPPPHRHLAQRRDGNRHAAPRHAPRRARPPTAPPVRLARTRSLANRPASFTDESRRP